MPRGSLHDETGWLNFDGRDYLLRRDEGGRWRLEFGFFAELKARKLLGKRVQLEGERDEYDLLFVRKLSPL